MVSILDDADVLALPPADAMDVLREALALHAAGALHAPPRGRFPLAGGHLVVTAGAVAGGPYGLRVYDTLADRDQVVAVWRADGLL